MVSFGEALQRARQLLAAGNASQAEQVYRRLVDAEPKAAEVWHELGIAQLQLGRPEAAVESVRQAVTLDPDARDYHVNLAAAYRMVRRPKEAIASFEQALQLGQPTAELYNNLALALKDAGEVEAALRAFHRALKLSPRYVNGHFNLGNLLHEIGRLEEAATCYQRTIDIQPTDVAAFCRLGMIHAELAGPDEQRLAAAEDCFRRALQLEPDYAMALANLAAVLARRRKVAEAVECWRQVLGLEPKFAEGHQNLGVLLAMQGDAEGAAACWQRALELNPNFAEPYNNLAALLTEQGHLDEAAACCLKALELKPDFAEAMGNLAGVLAKQERLEEAVNCYQRTLALKPNFAEMHNNLGAVWEQLGNFDAAAECCRRALDLRPDFPDATDNLGVLLAQQGRVDEARQVYHAALAHQPSNDVWRLSSVLLCPSMFSTSDEILAYRQRLLDDLKGLAGLKLSPDFPLHATACCVPSLNLQYHGLDDRPIRAAYANLLRDCFPVERAAGSPNGRRIGFVVTNRHEKAFVKSIGGVIERLDPEQFELVIIGSDRGLHSMRAAISGEHIQWIGVPSHLAHFVEAIRAAQLDLLYHWEVGTDCTNYLLPFYRLAPVQCTSWGVQFSAGTEHVDAYLSSALIEPDDAQADYNERLLLASTLLSYQRRVVLPERPKTRDEFGLPTDRNIYLCAQQLRKFHPDFDQVLSGILRRDPRGLVVAAEDQYGRFVASQLRARFAKSMPDVAERIVFLPCQPNADYLSLLTAADVLLDPLHYGGVNSSYDGFSLHKPIVTLPTRYQRGRYTLACYRKMGVLDCVARDPQDYVNIAVRLGTDADCRAAMQAKIREVSPVLFDDVEAVREHERLFNELLEQR